MESHFKITPTDSVETDVKLYNSIVNYYYSWNSLPPKGLVIEGYELVLVEIVDKDYWFKFQPAIT